MAIAGRPTLYGIDMVQQPGEIALSGGVAQRSDVDRASMGIRRCDLRQGGPAVGSSGMMRSLCGDDMGWPGVTWRRHRRPTVEACVLVVSSPHLRRSTARRVDDSYQSRRCAVVQACPTANDHRGGGAVRDAHRRCDPLARAKRRRAHRSRRRAAAADFDLHVKHRAPGRSPRRLCSAQWDAACCRVMRAPRLYSGSGGPCRAVDLLATTCRPGCRPRRRRVQRGAGRLHS